MQTLHSKSDFSLSGLKILLITHFFSTGPPQELRDYLKDKVNKMLYIAHPFPYCEDKKSSLVLYDKAKCVKKRYFFSMKGPAVLFYMKDFLTTIFIVLTSNMKFDIAVAADNLNALAAILLKRLRRVKKVIFFTIDYTPIRFKNRFLNFVYHRIDKTCCYNSDLVWDNSRVFQIEREKNGVDMLKCAPRCIVPIGNNASRIKRLPIEQINKSTIAYMGHVLKRQGIDLILDSLPELIKINPHIRFIIIGTGDYEKSLKDKTKKLGIEKHVEFKGYIQNHKDLENILTHCGIGVAPYYPDPTSVSNFSDIGKPKVYMACGLPVIITKVPPIAKEIAKKRTGIMIDYDKNQFITAVKRLLEDNKFYEECRNSAIEFASQYDWRIVFDKAFSESFANLK